MKLTAFAHARLLLFSRTGLSNLLNSMQAGYTQLVRSTGANVSVTVLQGYKSTPQKSRPIESGHGRHAVQVANVCSYKLGQK